MKEMFVLQICCCYCFDLKTLSTQFVVIAIMMFS